MGVTVQSVADAEGFLFLKSLFFSLEMIDQLLLQQIHVSVGEEGGRGLYYGWSAIQ